MGSVFFSVQLHSLYRYFQCLRDLLQHTHAWSFGFKRATDLISAKTNPFVGPIWAEKCEKLGAFGRAWECIGSLKLSYSKVFLHYPDVMVRTYCFIRKVI